MAYPPELPPSTRTDSTISADNHASDHNKIARALVALLDVLGAQPQGGYADLTSRLESIFADLDPRVASLVPDRVDTYLATNPAPANAAAAAVDTALANREVLYGPRIESYTSEAVLAITDEDDRRSWLEVGANGGPTTHAVNLVRAALNVFGLLAGTVTREALDETTEAVLPEFVARGSATAWAVTDEDGRLAIEVDGDGHVTLKPSAALLAELGVDRAQELTAAIFVDLPSTTGYTFVITDEDDRIGFGLRTDGVIDATVTRALNVPADDGYDPEAYTVDVAGPDGSRDLYLNDPTGTRTQLTDGTDDSDPVVRSDSRVEFTRAGGRLFVPFAPNLNLPGKDVHPLASRLDAWTMWGDSLTGANGIRARLQQLMAGRTIDNEGIGSQTAQQIAARQGGVDVLLTFSGGQLPDTGPGAVTYNVPILLTTNYPARSTTGYVELPSGQLIHGTLSYGGGNGNPYAFTRDTAGAAVPLAGPVRFFTDSQLAGEDRTVILWYGRNNINEDVPAFVRASVARLRPITKRYLVLGTTQGWHEPKTSSAWQRIETIKTELAADHGDRYIDLRVPMVANGLAWMGVTPTPADLVDLEGDTFTHSMMNGTNDSDRDTLHFNNAAYVAMTDHIIYPRIVEKGWA